MKYLLILLILLSLAACTDPDPMPFAENYMNAVNTKDPEQLLALYADDFVHEDIPYMFLMDAGPITGKTEMIDMLVKVFKENPDMEWVVHDVRGDPRSELAIEWVMTVQDIPVRGVSLLTIEDGKVTFDRQYYDMLAFKLKLEGE